MLATDDEPMKTSEACIFAYWAGDDVFLHSDRACRRILDSIDDPEAVQEEHEERTDAHGGLAFLIKALEREDGDDLIVHAVDIGSEMVTDDCWSGCLGSLAPGGADGDGGRGR